MPRTNSRIMIVRFLYAHNFTYHNRDKMGVTNLNTQSGMTSVLGVDRGAISRSLKDLQYLGMVRMVTRQGKAWPKYYYLTNKGIRWAEEFGPQYYELKYCPRTKHSDLPLQRPSKVCFMRRREEDGIYTCGTYPCMLKYCKANNIPVEFRSRFKCVIQDEVK